MHSDGAGFTGSGPYLALSHQPYPCRYSAGQCGAGADGGDDNTLNIKVGRAGFWDHWGGYDFASRATFDTIKQLVAKKDEETLRKLFTNVAPQGQPGSPQHFGAGVYSYTLFVDGKQANTKRLVITR